MKCFLWGFWVLIFLIFHFCSFLPSLRTLSCNAASLENGWEPRVRPNSVGGAPVKGRETSAPLPREECFRNALPWMFIFCAPEADFWFTKSFFISLHSHEHKTITTSGGGWQVPSSKIECLISVCFCWQISLCIFTAIPCEAHVSQKEEWKMYALVSCIFCFFSWKSLILLLKHCVAGF